MSAHRHDARWALWTAAVCFLLYSGNVLLGKLAAMQGVLKGWQAGNVYEALFLFLAVIAFVIAAIKRESREAAADDGGDGPRQANAVGGNDDAD